MTSALQGIRVVDLTNGPAGGIATMILADFGADVLLIEHPQATPHPLDEMPAAPMWQRGKQSVSLDLKQTQGQTQLHEICAGADIFVCNWRPQALQRAGLDYPSMHLKHPHLIYCHISGFGSHGPMADVPGYEHVIAAYAGRMHTFSGIVDRPGPVFSALQVGVHACAQAAVSGILATLLSNRSATGTPSDAREGGLVETSMLQGMLPYEQGAMLGTQFRANHPDRLPPMPPHSAEPPMPSLYYHPAQAGDGRWMQFGNLLPHLFDNFLLVTELVDVLADPDFNPGQMLLPPPKHEAFRARMLNRIQQRSAAQWMQDFIQDGGVVATTYQTTQQALQDPDVIANGHAVTDDHGSIQIGPVCRLTETPARIGKPKSSGTALAQQWRADPRPKSKQGAIADPASDLPLRGIRVVEIATIIAAPMGASMLADMGADVIKVEQIGGDPFRGMLAGIGSARVNAGKRSISVNLKTEAGREAVLKLIATADVLIHNYRPGVPERLGIGYDQVAALNPNIVYLQCNGYGPDGPGAQRPSTHPIPGAAMGGVMHQLGERVPTEVQDLDNVLLWTRRLMRANEVNPDPNTALVVTTSVMLGLVARQTTGHGQRVLVDMFGANAYANFDDFLTYPGKRPRAQPDAQLRGLNAGYQLYPCAQEQWLFLGLVTSREQAKFCKVIASVDLPDECELPLLEHFVEATPALEKLLETIFATQTATYWAELLTAAGLGGVRADGPLPSEFWLENTQAEQLGCTAAAEHPSWGPYQRHGPMVFFNGQSPATGGHPLGPPPMAGQHNSEILESLGYAKDNISQLTATGTLWQEAD